jgi:hypothetical protein
MTSKGIVDDSITKLPKNHRMQKEYKRYFLAVNNANPSIPIIIRMAIGVVTGENKE